ncbi:unnamed protein product [Ambrosiozyma monospora]|uniref:Unnamed protein product n=1 Tax=Ambrosiozyma monospora TaxID=43982 RepID=A0ACB5T6R2_AMBMO|nr:unnamed protein product [Ambrosiozyma monospora]
MKLGIFILIVVLVLLGVAILAVPYNSKAKNIPITETPMVLTRSQQVNLAPEYTIILQQEQQREQRRQSQPQLPLRSILRISPPPPYAAQASDQEGLQLDPTSSTTAFPPSRESSDASSPTACTIQRPPNSYQSPSRPSNPYEAQFVFHSGGSGGHETPPPEYTLSTSINDTTINTG